MNIPFAPFNSTFQARRDSAHPFFVCAREKLAERAADLKTPCPCLFSALEICGTEPLGGALRSAYEALPSGGLFLGVLAGGRSLMELRDCLTEAESELTGGAALRVAFLPSMEDLDEALRLVGFTHIVLDREEVTLAYDDLFALVRDLRALGMSWGGSVRRLPPRRLFLRADEIYQARHPAPSGNGIAVTAELFYMQGWRSGG